MTVSNRLNSTPPRLAGLLSSILMIAMMLIPASPASAQLGAVAQAMEPEYFTRDLLIFNTIAERLQFSEGVGSCHKPLLRLFLEQSQNETLETLRDIGAKLR